MFLQASWMMFLICHSLFSALHTNVKCPKYMLENEEPGYCNTTRPAAQFKDMVSVVETCTNNIPREKSHWYVPNKLTFGNTNQQHMNANRHHGVKVWFLGGQLKTNLDCKVWWIPYCCPLVPLQSHRFQIQTFLNFITFLDITKSNYQSL